MKILGMVLIGLGIVGLVYQGITYTRSRETVKLGPIGVTAERKETIPIPPVVGALAIVAGVVLVVKAKKT
ncbi:MAG: DUF3185 domain-containing protein [Anaerolineae bacterium]|nr:DUF3185 domain-containing protein [Gemmatimonadaceae bacterium]